MYVLCVSIQSQAIQNRDLLSAKNAQDGSMGIVSY